MFRMILLFTLLPLAELSLLLRIGEWLGAGPTLGLVIGTGILGAGLARREGLRTWSAVRRELSAGGLPGEELLHALLVLMAGILLVTPGVLTDAIGLSLMIRPVRGWVVRRGRRSLADRIDVHVVGLNDPGVARSEPGGARPDSDGSSERSRGGRVIEI